MSTREAKLKAWRNRIIKAGELAAHQFLAHELNARRHPGVQRDALRSSLDAVGFVAPVVVSSRSGKLLDGHARVEEALSRDEEQLIPFVEVDVTEEEERLILATYDPITGLALYDGDILSTLLEGLEMPSDALASLVADLEKKANAIDVEPPADFTSFDENLDTSYKCPKCHYEWSGSAK